MIGNKPRFATHLPMEAGGPWLPPRLRWAVLYIRAMHSDVIFPYYEVG
jgi:hypothetical protein